MRRLHEDHVDVESALGPGGGRGPDIGRGPAAGRAESCPDQRAVVGQGQLVGAQADRAQAFDLVVRARAVGRRGDRAGRSLRKGQVRCVSGPWTRRPFPRGERRQQVRPHLVEHALHVRALRGHRHHRVRLGQDQRELAVRAGGAVPMPADPELEAVPLPPVRIGIGGGHLRPGGLGDPLGRQQLFALPDAVVQVELSQLGDGLGGRVEPQVGCFVAGVVAPPPVRADAQRLEQPGPQEVGQRAAAHLPDDRGERGRARLVVGEERAGFELGRHQQQTERQVTVPGPVRLLRPLAGVPAGHRGHMPDPGGPRPRVDHPGVPFGEVGQHGGVEIDQALGHREAERGRDNALAQRVQHPRRVRPVRVPPALGHHVAVPQHQQAVQFDVGQRGQGGDERVNSGHVNALLGGGAPGKAAHVPVVRVVVHRSPRRRGWSPRDGGGQDVTR